jgi:fructose-1,6-bisphosphatase/inositol monophosphatase family enzyme
MLTHVAGPIELPVSATRASAIDVAWRCARVAGDLALSRFRSTQAIDVKGNRNIVTETDVEAELRVKDVLAEEFPSHKILSEETASDTDKPDVSSAVIGVDLGYDDVMGMRQLDLMRHIFPSVQGIRITGSAALGLAYAACGRFDLYTHMNVSPWDVAAGMLLIREAGGAASDRGGGPMRLTSATFAAGGRRVHDDFMARYAAAQGGGAPGR